MTTGSGTLRAALAVALVALACASTAAAHEGAPDPDFGGTGFITTRIGPNQDEIHGLAVDGAGRAIAAGVTYNGSASTQFALVRYAPSGAVDRSFGTNGVTRTSVGTYASAGDVALDRSGRIVAVGSSDGHVAIVRYSRDGNPDPAFNGTGIVTFSRYTGEAAAAVAVDRQGRIVVAGYTRPAQFELDFLLLRYSPDGKLDDSFGDHGVAITPVGPGIGGHPKANVTGVAIDGQGRIVAGGTATEASGQSVFAVARYRPSGRLDATYGDGGTTLTPIQNTAGATDLALDSRGRAILAGFAGDGTGKYGFALARYTTAGRLDPSFASGGIAYTVVGTSSTANAVRIDPQGRIVVAGDARVNGDYLDFGIARYDADGHLDRGFADAGRRTDQVGTTNARAWALAIDGHSRILVGGQEQESSTDEDFALARYVGDEAPPDVAITGGPRPGGFTRDATPAFSFRSADPTAGFRCTFDALAPTLCRSPFAAAVALRDGRHTFSVRAVDPAGNASAAVARSFRVDTRRPRLRIRGPAVIRTRRRTVRVRFRLAASEPVRRLCKVDRRRTVRCASAYRTPKLRPGRHRLKVTAVDRAGNRAVTSRRFRIVRRHR